MQYNYSFEMSALIIMFLLLFIIVIKRDFYFVKGKSFLAFLIACIVESAANVLSSWGLANTDIVSSRANWWICFVFFVAEAATSILYFRYVVNLCEASRHRRTLYAQFALLPFTLFIAMIVATRPFDLIFDVVNNVYKQGRASWFGYLYIAIYLIAGFVVAITAKNTIRGRNRYAVVFATFISVTGVLVQYNHKTLILTGFANAIVLLMFYIMIQNTNELRDKITNTQNDRAFYMRFENTSNQERMMQIIVVDIHQQSDINALFGYHNGNLILGEVGEFLNSVAGEKNVYHISMNVFAVVLEGNEDSKAFCDTIFERFERPWTLESLETMVNVNISKICYPNDVKNISDFYGLNNFIKPLLRKDTMRNYLEMTPDLMSQYTRITQVEKALYRAINSRSLRVHFQPIYDVKKNKFTSLEALARMYDPELGFVAPDEFILAAEANGAIVPLDLMILEKTCEFIEKEILTRKNNLSIETVQINISVLQCMQPNMDEIILSIIDKYNVPHEMIMLEITERASVSAYELMERHMRSLNEKGIKFALDDYGTGNSNCSYLIEYPFDKVKFDKSMVWAYFETEPGRIILDGEMNTISNLNIPIVAEGIEEKQQLDEMTKLGVSFIQGYYFSKPLPPEDTVEFLVKNQDI